MGLSLVTAPTSEPLSIAEVKGQLSIDFWDADDWLQRNIKAARQHVETETRRALKTQTWDFTIDYDWPVYEDAYGCRQRIVLPLPPVQSVTSVKYIDTAGTQQTLATNQYLVNTSGMEALIEPAYGVTWPTVRGQMNAITVWIVCGYSAVPEPLRLAMLLLIGHWWTNRDAVTTNSLAELPLGVDSLMGPYRVFY